MLKKSDGERCLARVPERPQALAVCRGDAHVDGDGHAVASSDLFDQADCAGDRGGRVVLQAEREREEEEELRVGRALDQRIELGVDRERELALHVHEVVDQSVVHPEPAAVAEWVAVAELHRRVPSRRGRARTRAGLDMPCELTQVPVVPGRLDAAKHGRRLALVVPADPEAIAVRLLVAEARVQALHDQRALRLVEKPLDANRGARICEPTTYRSSPFCRRRCEIAGRR